MATGSLFTALVGFIGVIVGAVISAVVTVYTTNKKQEAANRRLREKQYLEKKVEKMTELHAELDDCFQTIEDFLENMSHTTPPSEYEEVVEPKIESFHKTFLRNSIYLTEDQKKAIFDVKMQFGMIGADIEDFLKKEDWDEEPRTHQGNLRDSWEEAKDMLKEEMDVSTSPI